MAPTDTPDIEGLLARALSNELLPAEAAALAEACRLDSTVLDALAQQTLTHRLLQSTLRDPHGFVFSSEIAIRLRQNESGDTSVAKRVGTVLKFQRLRRQVFQWAATLTVSFGLLWLSQRDTATARVERTEALIAQDPVSAGQALAPGALVKLEAGLVALRFGCGAEVLLEGPAELEIQDAWHGVLKKGRIVAKVGRAAHGFTLDGPGGRLVDLGTKFAVAVEDGKSMELHVLEGLVEATALGEKKPRRVTANQAVRLGSGVSEPITDADQGAFVTALPPKSGGKPRFVHWSFEELGAHFANTGHGLASGEADLDLKTPSPEVTSASIPGPFGHALEFAGDGTYAESGFKGIGGSEPRTVAFWLKVPSDFRLPEGYAVVSWGSRIQDGAAWQISVNPDAKDGPVGRLRVGVHKGPVVGTTDLRDEQWHHCSVVMYGGTGADISTHILLYIDGHLESAARKAVMPVLTDTHSPLSHGVWLGRNLTKSTGTQILDAFRGPSFRGAVDEVFIFDSALNQTEILHLMKHNTPG